MKWLIASDLHGSVPCCERLLAAYEREGAEGLVLLGDVLRYGPDDRTVAKMLNGLEGRVIAVRGNCDTERTQELLAFALQPGYVILPMTGGKRIFATHGHIYNSAHLPPALEKGDILLQGHTHVPMTEAHAGFLCFNPGSAAQPRWGSERSYMTMEGGVFLWKTLDGEEYRRYEL